MPGHVNINNTQTFNPLSQTSEFISAMHFSNTPMYAPKLIGKNSENGPEDYRYISALEKDLGCSVAPSLYILTL